MPLAAAIIPAVIGAGAAVYSASKASNASKQANAAQQQAADKQLAAQQANLDRVIGLNQPFISGGQASYAKLLQQFGITPAGQPGSAGTSPLEPAPSGYGPGVNNYAPPAGGTGPLRADDTFIDPRTGLTPGAGGGSGPPMGAGGAPTAPAAPAAPAAPTGPAYPGAPQTIPGAPGHFDPQAYLAEYPDVMANARQRVADGTAASVEQVAQEHYNAYGAPEHRDQPMTGGTPDTVVPDFINGVRPEAAPAPTFGPRTDFSAPNLDSFFSNFEADPGAAYRRSEALNGVNAGSAVRGKLRSGDAAKALATLASNLGSQEYNNWFNRQQTKFGDAQGQYAQQQGRSDANYNNDRAYGTGLWQNQRDFNNGNFNDDRGFQTNRYDTNTQNLFDLTRVGTNAAANVSGAGTNYANNASNIYGNQGDATANNAFNKASATSYGVNGVANAASNLFSNWGGGSSYGTPGSYGSGYVGATNGSAYGQPGANPFTIY